MNDNKDSTLLNIKNKEYALIGYDEYTNLLNACKSNIIENRTVIALEDMLFLNSILQLLNLKNATVTFFKNSVTIHGYTRADFELNSTFDISICKDYYTHLSRFIQEVI